MAKILIVDDHPTNREFLVKLLGYEKHQLLEAGDGAEALDIVRRERPELVISDILMPTMDGFEFVRELRREPGLETTRVMFYSAVYCEQETRVLAESCGVTHLLSKPAPPAIVLETVNAALQCSNSRVHVVPTTLEFDREHLRLMTTKLAQKVEELRASEAKLRHILAACPAVIYSLAFQADNKPFPTWVSEYVTHLTGFSVAESLVPSWWHEHVHPQDKPNAMAAIQDAIAKGYSICEYRVRCKDDNYRWVQDEKRLQRDEDGHPVEIVGSWSDINERRQLEAQFRQAQKMEAIGRLAGGVAHDFNNVLTVISGYSEILLGQVHEGDPFRVPLEQIKRSGERAAGLTRQLLAFSRKQVLNPEILNLNSLLGDMEKMLRRLIGEDVDLVLTPGNVLWPVRVDPGQIEQVVMNIAVNARDAMPQGGKLTIETRNVDLDQNYANGHGDVRPGQYVLLAISDTGCGMSAEIKARIFEPFFTTKPQDKGTGLGLATVYGIVKQSGGSIQVHSELEVGTTFKICLPRTHETTAASKSVRGLAKSARGSETVLLVEDEEPVRQLARMALETHGYNVLEAANGGEALLLAEHHHEPIHLLLTDVVMPRVSGRQLADHLTPLRPTMKVLYVSGYTDDAIIRHGLLDSKVPFLAKPYTVEALMRRVREVLDRLPMMTSGSASPID